MPTVLLIGTLDTKGREYQYMKERVRAAGADCLVIDVGVLGAPTFAPDIGADEVAEEGGASLAAIRFSREGSDTRAVALETMQRGATTIARRLHAEGRCDAVLGAGGSGGSTVVAGVMRALPVGLPKLLVSTMAMHDAVGFVGSSDIAIMNAVTDIAGLNRVSRHILGNAAVAAAAMAGWRPPVTPSREPLVAITMFGITTPGVLRLQERLEESGFETVVFHAVGSGGRAMEEMIDGGLIDGVIDYTVSELTDELLGGVFPAGPDRLEAAGRRGIPQVVVPGAIEVLNFGARDSVPARYDEPQRRLIVHNPHVCAVRTTRAEGVALARLLADKLNRGRGPRAVLLPLKGLDAYQKRPDGPFIDDDADTAFFAALREALNPDIECRDFALNINDPAFADAAFATFVELWHRDIAHAPA